MKKYVFAALLCALCVGCRDKKFHHVGTIFGTYYNIQYRAEQSYEQEILRELRNVDSSLSIYNPSSTIYRINHNVSYRTDTLFECVFAEARNVHECTHGAFDITIAPLVNYWGFGTKSGYTDVSQKTIDSLMQYVGMEKVTLANHLVIKQDSAILLDANAIAKGFGCDQVARFLEANKCSSFLIDIGGEIVAKGMSERGRPWRIGITKPLEDTTGTLNELQQVLEVTDICMATSGNYRQFHYRDSLKCSHTIDPKTGYFVEHTLLSATVIAPSCMRADALATACMVLGKERALQFIDSLENTSCYLIYDTPTGLQTCASTRWPF